MLLHDSVQTIASIEQEMQGCISQLPVVFIQNLRKKGDDVRRVGPYSGFVAAIVDGRELLVSIFENGLIDKPVSCIREEARE